MKRILQTHLAAPIGANGLKSEHVGSLGRLVALFFGCAIALSGYEAFAYSENFDSGSPGWSTVAGSWSASGGTFNSNAVGAADMAVYNGTTWATNFSLHVDVLNEYGGAANRVGIVYNYVDASNYYRVEFGGDGPPGTAILTKVIAGSATSSTSTYSGGGPLVWFGVDVIRAGTSTTIKVNGSTVFNAVSQSELGAGKVGFWSRFSVGRFDNLVLTETANYSETFASGATGWAAASGTWGASGGTYNSAAVGAADRALYGGATWSSNYTLHADLLNPYNGAANRVGLIYNYVDANNYYQVDFGGNGPPGTATLTKVVAGTSTASTSAYSGGGPSVWFGVDVVRSGISTAIKVNGATIFSGVVQSELGAGKVGFVTIWAPGGFDNVSVTTSGGSDTQAPTIPSGLIATAVASNQVDLNWVAAGDNIGVSAYLVERCTGSGCSSYTQVASISGTSYGSSALSAATSYTFRVRATDAAGNLSGYSAAVSATTFGPSFGESFATGATGWAASSGTWSVSSGTYNSTSVGAADRTLYGGATWATNFTLHVDLFNAYGGAANRVGLVYNYVDANNYYQIDFGGNGPPGTATLTKVIGGTSTASTASYSGGGPYVWFGVDVIRSGVTTTIKVNGTTIFSAVSQPELGAGKIGFVTIWAPGSFDNVSVTGSPGGSPGGSPSVALTAPSSTTVAVQIAALPTVGRSVIGFTVERSLDGGTSWTNVNISDPVAASETPAQNAQTPTKRVSPSGTLGGQSAYTTLQAAFDAAVPGDVIAIGPGVYNARAILTRSGTSTSRIYVRPWDYANRPTFDAQYSSAIVPGWVSPYAAGQVAVISIMAEYVTIDGINVRNSPVNGIIVGDSANNGAFTSAPTVFYRGIELIRVGVIGTSAASLRSINTDGLRVLGSTFLDSERSRYTTSGYNQDWGASITLLGKNPVFIENVVGQSSGEGLHVGYHGAFGGGDGWAHIEATNVTIRNNRFFDCWSAPLYLTNVDGGVIERNVIWHTSDTRYWYGASAGYPQYGLDIASESGNTGVKGFNGFIGARNLIIRNNIVTGAVFPFRLPDWPSQQTTNIKVLYNTFYATTPGTAASVASLVSNFESSLTNVAFQGNLVYEPTPAQMARTWVPIGGTSPTGSNIFSTAPPSALAGPGDIISASPGLVDGTYRPSGNYPAVNPFDPTKLQIVATSPAVNVGTVLTDVTQDFFGNPRPSGSGRYDIGAHSLSKPNLISYQDAGRASGTTYWYRARYTQSDGVVGAWSAISAITTP